MKKAFLLGILPALMALSSCAGAGSKVEPKNDNLFLEDTLAHEEIFGEAEIEIQNYKQPLRSPELSPEPTYGVQYQDAGDYVHMRFIAAVSLPDVGAATAKWTRTMYKGHGEPEGQSGAVYKAQADKECTRAYTSLVNGESTLTLTAFNTEYGTSYNYFIVYTMLNIPKEGYEDYSIRAFVTISDVASTKGVAATVGKTANATFDLDRSGHFISGRFNGSHNEFASNHDLEGNYAAYDVTLKEGDTFALIYYNSETNVFLLNGTARDDDKGYFCDNSKNTMTSNYDGDVTVYLNTSDKIYIKTSVDLIRPIYVDVSERTWWGQASDRYTALWAFGGSKADEWIVLNRVGTSNLYVTPNPIDPADHDQFIVVDSRASTPTWDTLENRSKDSETIDARSGKDCLKIWDQDTGDGHDYKWWVSWVAR